MAAIAKEADEAAEEAEETEPQAAAETNEAKPNGGSA